MDFKFQQKQAKMSKNLKELIKEIIESQICMSHKPNKKYWEGVEKILVIEVVRIGQRLVRDDRVTTHVALVSRAFGAEQNFMTEVNPEIKDTLKKINKLLGEEILKLNLLINGNLL